MQGRIGESAMKLSWPGRRKRSLTVELYPRRLADGNEVPLPGYRTYREILDAPTRPLPTVEPGTPIAGPYVTSILLAILVLVMLAGCYPDSNGASDTGGTNHAVSCSIFRPSAPYRVKGPNADGPNQYTFTSRADGEVSCSEPVAQISVTVVFHYVTNGLGGATTGRTTVCSNKRECASFADYQRQHLDCRTVYHYTDYGQVTAWYAAFQTSGQVTIASRESPHKLGDSYNPREAGCR
jgi:hypothetical protein